MLAKGFLAAARSAAQAEQFLHERGLPQGAGLRIVQDKKTFPKRPAPASIFIFRVADTDYAGYHVKDADSNAKMPGYSLADPYMGAPFALPRQ